MTCMMICYKCYHRWFDGVGQFGQYYGPGCPKCGSLYWHWYITREQLSTLTGPDKFEE